ncbi:unnamed protein product [Toxocara canis]|uniref:WD_REPEATS_REGION domain-containing protein n=1 Tax=Toxocara canis TaxID=6265 RepID=A0A183UY22_TOXCA|nr:unnamed protein product [Toxocara canis]
MTRHGKNSTASAVYSYAERKKDAKQSGYGTLHERLSADSIKEFDCCSITLQPCRQVLFYPLLYKHHIFPNKFLISPCTLNPIVLAGAYSRDPVISPYGYIFDREAVLEYYLQQKKENVRKLKEWEKQCKKDEEDAEKRKRLDDEKKLKKFVAGEATPAHPVIESDTTEDDGPTTSAGATASGSNVGKKRKASDDTDDVLKKRKMDDSVSNVAGNKIKENPSFWVPQLIPTAEEAKLQKPDQRVLCPMSGRPLKIKELMPVKFTKIADGDDGTKWIARKVRYMCPVTHDALTNTTRCAYLKTSQSVVTMSCVEQIIRKDMIDPINGMKLCDDDIIELQRGGTGPKRPRMDVVSSGSQRSHRRSSNLQAPIMMLSGHEGEIYAAKFSPDGTCIATGGFDMKIFLWNVYGNCENFSVLKGHIGAVMDVHFSTDSGYLFSASTDKTVRVWDMETGTCVRKFKSHKDIVNSCHPARRGPQLVCSGSDDGTVIVHDIRKKDPIAILPSTYQITAVSFDDTAEQVFGGGIDNDIKVIANTFGFISKHCSGQGWIVVV